MILKMQLQLFSGSGNSSGSSKRGGGASKGKGKAPTSLKECSNFGEVKSYLESRGISVDDRIGNLKFEETKNAMDGALYVLDEFGATEKLTGFGINSHGVMCADYRGNISFNEKYFKEGTRNLDAVMNGSSFHPANQNAFSTGAHEAGHILESYISRLNNYGGIGADYDSGGSWQSMLDWNNCTVSKNIINKCGNKVKAQYKARGEKAPSLDTLCYKVSGYASKNRSEAFAECIADYVANGKNANALSIEVWNYTKKLMNK